MEKQEFFDKIDKVREMVDGVGDSYNVGVDDILQLLDELKSDANQLLEDEYDEGYNLGLDRGVDADETSARTYGHGEI
jgi:hypothetical protein